MPSSKQKEALAAHPPAGGLHRGLRRAPTTAGRPGKMLTISMKYSPERSRTISGLRRVSKPGLRVYSQGRQGAARARRPRRRRVSTSQGLMTDREARKRQVGGEVLCFVW